MKKRTYHGWIYIEKSPGLRDHFEVHRTRPGQSPQIEPMGYGPRGAAAAVAFFEEAQAIEWDAPSGIERKVAGLSLGPVKLEPTPLGLRVYTEEDE